MKKSAIILILLVESLACGLAYGHARLRITNADNSVPRLTPRNALDANKGGVSQADLPCGRDSLTRDPNPVVLTAGETILVEMEETINHNGRYEVNFSPDGTNGFLENNLLTIVDDQAGAPSRAAPNRYQGNIIVPNTPCTTCTLQMTQVMVNGATENFYKSCVDIIITPAASPPPAAPTGFVVESK